MYQLSRLSSFLERRVLVLLNAKFDVMGKKMTEKTLKNPVSFNMIDVSD